MEFRDLKQQYQVLKSEIDMSIQNVLTNCNFIGGSQVEILEKQLADYVGAKHCITCGNGTDALML
ncbi:MAG: DegT/DnrJ/EryC1/StrS family aminotransferase, partial [Oscillospiraceae bacterium]